MDFNDFIKLLILSGIFYIIYQNHMKEKSSIENVNDENKNDENEKKRQKKKKIITIPNNLENIPDNEHFETSNENELLDYIRRKRRDLDINIDSDVPQEFIKENINSSMRTQKDLEPFDFNNI